MHLLPVHEEFVWEVTTAGKWLDQLDIAISSGEIYIEELDLLISRYPNPGCEPSYHESAAELLLKHLLPHRHPEAVALVDELYKAYGQKAVDVLLVALVLLCDKISDAIGVKKAYEALVTPTSAWRARISEVVRQLGRNRGGKALKRKPGIWQHVLDTLADNPSLTARRIWHSIPKASPGEEEKGILVSASRTSQVHEGKWEQYWLYRDVGKRVDKLVQVRDSDGNEQAIEFSTFTKYFTDARKTLA